MEPLPRNVKALGVVSFLNDASSEMIYPLLPAFITGTLGASPEMLGAIEGAAEAAAACVKVAAGRLSDRTAQRKPLVVLGYSVASIVRPLIGLATSATQILGLRVLDRVGKGVRSGPRDALIVEATPEKDRGRAFGFHRAMDHAGAFIGPLLASAVLFFRADLRFVFILAAIPAAAAVLTILWRVRETAGGDRPAAPSKFVAPDSPVHPRAFAAYLTVLAVFALGNSSDTFLLLRAQERGVTLGLIPLLWAVHHLVKSAVSTYAGGLSDRMGRKGVIVIGWMVYTLAYAGFAAATRPWHFWALFAGYALFHAFSEGPQAAMVADLSPASTRGRHFGAFHAVTGGMQLPASLLTGYLWQRYGGGVALGVGGGLAALSAAGLLLLVPAPRATTAT